MRFQKIMLIGLEESFDVSPILWEIVFSDEDNKNLLYEHIRFIIDNYFQ